MAGNKRHEGGIRSAVSNLRRIQEEARRAAEREPCPTCDDTGIDPDSLGTCPTCHGDRRTDGVLGTVKEQP